jgi:hypothetical protein
MISFLLIVSILLVLVSANEVLLSSSQIQGQTYYSPTKIPTKAPSKTPTKTPTAKPTMVPTVVPTKAPTKAPTTKPTIVPTNVPTKTPTKAPTASPSVAKTAVPTAKPTFSPSVTPTKTPTAVPSRNPTKSPTVSPTVPQTAVPTVQLTMIPTKTPSTTPSVSPTKAPTVTPSKTPTVTPSDTPTKTPTGSPSTSPESTPTAQPTAECQDPTAEATMIPTEAPTAVATVVPSETPSVTPTDAPTETPLTDSPTASPTTDDTSSPTSNISPSAPSNNPEDECHDGELPTSVPSSAPSQTEKNDDDSDDFEYHEKNVCITTIWSVSSVSNCELSSQGQTALLQTIANLLGVSRTNVEFVRIVESVQNEQTMRVEIKISINLLQHPEFNNNSTELYNYVQTVLSQSVPGSSTNILREEAKASLATELYESTITKVDISSCIGETTEVPTLVPTEIPSVTPSVASSEVPSETPSAIPTGEPAETAQPTAECHDPSAEPTMKPTEAPTAVPTIFPSETPSMNPTDEPTETPLTDSPTETPTSIPSSSSPSTTNPEDECHDGELPTSAPSPAPSTTEKNGDGNGYAYYSDDSECQEKNVCISTIWSISDVANCEISYRGKSALLQTIANLLGVSETSVEFVRIVDSVQNEQTMRVEIKISINLLQHPEFNNNSTELYNYVQSVLSQSVPDSFTAMLREEAKTSHAAELCDSTITTVDISLCAIQAAEIPTEFPTVAPSEAPTEEPSQTLSVAPSQVPFVTPSATPDVPSTAPSQAPSVEATVVPTLPVVVPSTIPTRTPTVFTTQAPLALSPNHMRYKGFFKLKVKSVGDWTNSCKDNLLLAMIFTLKEFGNLQNVEYLGSQSNHRRLDTTTEDQEVNVAVRFTFNLDTNEDSDSVYSASTTTVANSVADHQMDSDYHSLGEDKDSSVVSVEFEREPMDSSGESSSSDSNSKNSWMGVEFTSMNIGIIAGGGVFVVVALILLACKTECLIRNSKKPVSLRMDGSRDTIKPEDFVALTITDEYGVQKGDDSSYMEDNFIHRHGLKLVGSLDGQS